MPYTSLVLRCTVLAVVVILVGFGVAPPQSVRRAGVDNHPNGAVGRSNIVSEGFKRGIQEFTKTSLGDLAFVQRILGTTLSEGSQVQGSLVRKSDQGTFEGYPVRDIELRSGLGGEGPHVLLFTITPPGVPFATKQWPEAMPSPPDPGANDSKGYWKVPGDGVSVVFGMNAEESHIVQVAINNR